jgi:AcrR family transcriptional regulator
MTRHGDGAADAAAASSGGSRGLAREQAILSAAMELIAEVGYERVTVDAIAARAQSSKMTMYRRWPDGKSEIVAEALRRHAEAGMLTVPDSGSLRGDLRAEVRRIARSVSGDGGPSLVGLVEGIRDDDRLRKMIRDQIVTATSEIASRIAAQAVARGEPATAERVSLALSLAVSSLLASRLLSGVTPDAAAQRHLLDDVLMPLLASPVEPKRKRPRPRLQD